MAGRKLTEREKAERAAKRIVKKEEAELGPLFEDQAQPAPDVDQLLIDRRMGHARNVEHSHRVLDRWLDEFEYQRVRRLLIERGMTAEEVDASVRHIRNQEAAMRIDHCKGILRDRFGERYTIEDCWRRCSTCWYYHAPGQAVCYERPRAELTRSPVFILKGDP